MMKNLLSFFAGCLVAFQTVSCQNFKQPTKLVRSITWENRLDVLETDYRYDYEFEYDDDNRLIRSTLLASTKGPKESKYSDADILRSITYAYDKDIIVATPHVVTPYGMEKEHEFSLHTSGGELKSIEVYDKYADKWHLVNLAYANDEIILKEDGAMVFPPLKYESGNLTLIPGTSFYETENKMNLDCFAFNGKVCQGGWIFDVLAEKMDCPLKFEGVTSKNLPRTVFLDEEDFVVFTYEFDSEGYPVEIHQQYSASSDKTTYRVSYTR